MTVQEFSNEFDVLVSSYRRFKDFDSKEELDSIEFNEYEKSFFLTKAQEELVLSLYNGKNSSGDSFESSEEMRRHLGSLVEEIHLTPASSFGPFVKYFELPSDLWFIIYERALITDGKCGNANLDVYPVKHDEYTKLRYNPFRGANSRRVLRIDRSEDEVQLVSIYNIEEYYIRYLKRLTPIILRNLPDDLTIDGENEDTPCIIHEKLHQRILEMAVLMALQSKGIGVKEDKK